MDDLDVLTVPELRGKLQEMNRDASISENTAIRAYAHEMLAAVTADRSPRHVVEPASHQCAGTRVSGTEVRPGD